MSPAPDIENLLRQKQMMDQFNQITSQGTQSALMQPGIRQFEDIAPQQVQQQQQRGGGYISGLLANAFTPKDPSVHSLSYEQAQDPAQRPQLIRAPGSSSLELGPGGQLTINQTPQFSPARYTPGMLGQ